MSPVRASAMENHSDADGSYVKNVEIGEGAAQLSSRVRRVVITEETVTGEMAK